MPDEQGLLRLVLGLLRAFRCRGGHFIGTKGWAAYLAAFILLSFLTFQMLNYSI